jgi:hypothetical protein
MFSLFRRKPSVNPIYDIPDEQNQAIVEAEAPKVPKYNGSAPKERYDQIEYAFTSGGVHYFKFNAEVNIPFQRAIAARDILTEELWQINPDFLRGWVEGVLGLVVNGKVTADKKIFDIGIMATRLKEQLELSFSLVRQMKLATVIYFDEYENPLDYQYPYNQQKMKSWMANNDVPGFFLKMLDFQSVPSLKELEANFPNFLQAETAQKIADLKHTISLMSSGKESEDLLNLLNSQMEMLLDISSWSKDQFTNTI